MYFWFKISYINNMIFLYRITGSFWFWFTLQNYFYEIYIILQMLHSLYENAVYTRTDLKPLYATKEALKYTFIVWFSFPLHLFFPSIALAHILGRFLLQFQLPLGNTSSVTFHLVNICLGKRKSKCAKCVQKRWQVFYPIYSNWSCLLQICAYRNNVIKTNNLYS